MRAQAKPFRVEVRRSGRLVQGAPAAWPALASPSNKGVLSEPASVSTGQESPPGQPSLTNQRVLPDLIAASREQNLFEESLSRRASKRVTASSKSRTRNRKVERAISGDSAFSMKDDAVTPAPANMHAEAAMRQSRRPASRCAKLPPGQRWKLRCLPPVCWNRRRKATPRTPS
jgi:hypothetical protein